MNFIELFYLYYLQKNSASFNSNLLSHPVFLEYIKSYDSVVNFRNIIIKNLPKDSSSLPNKGFLSQYYDQLVGVRLVELDKEAKITPQVIEMTASVENVLTEVSIVFSKLIDELVASKYDTLEKEQQLIQQRALVIIYKIIIFKTTILKYFYFLVG